VLVDITEVLFLADSVSEMGEYECLMGESGMIAKEKRDLEDRLKNIMGNLVVTEADCDER
jgi:hypothetical protein